MDDLRPAPNGQTVFRLAAINRAGYSSETYGQNPKEDVQLKITLTPGLSFASSSMPDTTISGNTATWRVGELPATGDATRTKTLNVPVNLSGSAPLETRCLTAEVDRVTPPDRDRWRYDDAATVCLGDHPPELIGGGDIDLFTFFPCIGVTAYPCNANDTLELVTELKLSSSHPVTKQRRDDVATRSGRYASPGSMLLPPELVTIHVDDRRGRDMDDDENVIWSTENLMNLRDSQARLASSWIVQEAVTVTAPGGGDAPGRWEMLGDFGGHDLTSLLVAPDSSKVTSDAWTLSDLGNNPSDWLADAVFHFGALGTYKVLLEITGTLSGTTYTDSATYTFHVGPAAELEVRQGDRPQGRQKGYVIEAVNNGPSAAAGVLVTLTGVPEGARADASRGRYEKGSCDANGLCQGFWTIGEMNALERARELGGSEKETLTIFGDGDPITAAIKTTQDYSVVVDGTRHSTEYYDHIGDNNEAQITSQSSTGRGDPNAPQELKVQEFGDLALLRWEAPTGKLVNGWPVTHYQVERNGVLLPDEVAGTIHADVRGGAVNQSYRVRAVNYLGGHSPWSNPTMTGPDAPGDFTAEQLQGGEVRLTWTKPDGNGAAVTDYTIQVSVNGGQSWSDTGAQLGPDDTSWVHGNLSVGPVRLYRIQARTANGPGAWAQATSASIAAPTLTADYDDASEITLSWTMPGGNAVPVLAYELEHSTDGANWSRLATVRAADGMSYTHRGLSPGAFRHYRARAVTALGHGPWSDTATATTAAGAPRLTAAANGPNEIALSWSKPGGDAEIFEYQLERNTEGSDWSHLATVYPEDGRSYADVGLSAGATWSYRVRAISLSGGHTLEGDWSAEVSATTDSGGPANAPTGLTATADGENRIDLSWAAPAAGGGSVTGYRIEHSADGMKWQRLRDRHAGTSYRHAGLMSGMTYHYRVAALSGSRGGPYSTSASATTAGEPTTVPGTPTDLRVTGVERNRVSLAWGPPAEDGGTRVTGYEYRYWGPCAADPDDLCQSESRRVSGTAATVSGLNVAGTYDFRVRAVNAVGAGEWADPVQAVIAPPPARGEVVVSPASLTLTEGGSATYRVRLSSNPTQPVQVSLFAEDPDEVLNGSELAGQQRMILLPSNYAPPEGAMWEGWAYRWNVGVPITVVASDDEVAGGGGTAVIHHDVWTAPADLLGNPPGWAEDPVYHGMTGPAVKVTVRDND